MKNFVLGLIVIVFAGGLFVGWEGLRFLGAGLQSPGEDRIFDVRPGDGFYQVAERLRQEGLVTSARYFKILGRITGEAGKLRVGEYAVRTDMRPMELIAVLSSGKSIERQITFPEGWNRYEMAALVETKGLGTKEQFLTLTANEKLIEELLGEKHESLEGYLFPETYSYTKYSTQEALVRAMVAGFKKAYEGLNHDSAKTGLSRHQLVTLASVVEKETGSEADRPLIASVFRNRLRKGMRLQSDPTILYGLLKERGEMPQNITKDDIQHPTPYNTYTVDGLPAGPISNPGLKALAATVSPQESNYFFFVSKNDGTTTFSESLTEHNSAVQKYQVNPKARAGKSWRNLNKKK